MAYAVTCSSCGARFSVGDELVQKKLAGRWVTVRCKQCQATIRLNATLPPQPNERAPQTGAGIAREPRARPVPPRPPLKRQNRDSPGPFVALSPGLLGSPSLGDDGDLFDSPRSSSQDLIDLSDAAQSLPPSSNAPTARRPERSGVDAKRTSEDVDFLLGLSDSPVTNTDALLGPPLPSFDPEPAPATMRTGNDQAIGPDAAETAASSAAPASGAPKSPSRRSSRVWGVALATVCLAAIALIVRLVSGTEPEEAAGLPAPHAESPPAPEPAVAAESSAPETVATPGASVAPAAAASASAAAPRNNDLKPNLFPSARRSPLSTPGAPQPASASPSAKASAAAAETAPGTDAPPEAPPAGPFSKSAATAALAAAVEQASACRKPGDPSGTANVMVTFAPSGRVTSATISGPPFAGTPTGGCIAASLRRARVPAFEGEKVTVTKSVVIH